MARILEISPSTFSLWKTQHSAFSKALEYGREACNGALEATAVQRALGYSYETEKAFQTGVRMTVTETMPPDPNMLKFLLRKAHADKYAEGASKRCSIPTMLGRYSKRSSSAWSAKAEVPSC